MPNPNVISLSPDSIAIKNAIYEDAITFSDAPFDVIFFKGASLHWDGSRYVPTQIAASWPTARAILTETVYLAAGETKIIRILTGGEVYADRVLFVEGENLFTIPPDIPPQFPQFNQPYILQLKLYGIIVKFGDNITENDFPSCEIVE